MAISVAAPPSTTTTTTPATEATVAASNENETAAAIDDETIAKTLQATATASSYTVSTIEKELVKFFKTEIAAPKDTIETIQVMERISLHTTIDGIRVNAVMCNYARAGTLRRRESICAYADRYKPSQVYLMHFIEASQTDVDVGKMKKKASHDSYDKEVKQELERFVVRIPCAQVEDMHLTLKKSVASSNCFQDVTIECCNKSSMISVQQQEQEQEQEQLHKQ